MLLRGAGVLALSGVIIAVVSSEGLLPSQADTPRLAATSAAPPQDERPAQPVAIADPLPGPAATALTAIAPDAIEAAKEAVRRAASGEAADAPPPAAPHVAAAPAEAPRVDHAPASVRVEAHSAHPATPATAALQAALAAKAASAVTKPVAAPPATGSVGEQEQAATPAQAEPAAAAAVTEELEAALAAKAAALKALSAEPPAAPGADAPAAPPVVATAQPAPAEPALPAALPGELPTLQNAALDLSQDPTLLEDEGSTEQDVAAPLPRPRPEPPPNAIKRTASRASGWGSLGAPPNCGDRHAYWRYTDRKAGKREWYCK
jgi:hypothetical protein